MAISDRDAFDEEFDVDGDVPALLPEGEYNAACRRAETVEFFKFGRARKLILHFEIYDGQYTGTKLFLPMAAPGKGEKIGRGSKVYKNILIATGQPPGRRDRVALKVFKNRLFRVKIKTVRPVFEDGKPKPDLFHYSVIAELLERLA